MPTIIKVNSKIGMVSFSKEDMANFGLLKWLRTDSKGLHHRCFIDQQPFEKAASHVFHEKYPSTSVKIADKIILGQDGTVDIFLRITNDFSRGHYNSHPTKLTFSHSKGTKLNEDAKDYTEVFDYTEFDKKKASADSIEMKDLRDVVSEFFEKDSGDSDMMIEVIDTDEPSVEDVEDIEDVSEDTSALSEEDIKRIVDEALEEFKEDIMDELGLDDLESGLKVSEKDFDEE